MVEKEYAANGNDIAVYAQNSKVSINGKPYKAFINPHVDLAAENWKFFKHHKWIFPSESKNKEK